MLAARALLPVALAAALGLAGCGGSSSSSSSSDRSAATTAAQSTSGTTPATPATPAVGFEGMPLETGGDLAPSSSTVPGQTVDGIQCGSKEQLTSHVHTHLTVDVDGRPRAVPGGIGIPGSQNAPTRYGPVALGGTCIYWLHTHTGDGVIHIESPDNRPYTLGQFFDEWHQPLSRTSVGPAHGAVTAWVDGKRWTGDPRSIRLGSRADIQLDVGAPVPGPQPVPWAATQL